MDWKILSLKICMRTTIEFETEDKSFNKGISYKEVGSLYFIKLPTGLSSWLSWKWVFVNETDRQKTYPKIDGISIHKILSECILE